ncbi:MAG TPA: beta-ketoacyl synthase N-terminal-like domain-containing protein [Pyrinomonadaceae bacterium]
MKVAIASVGLATSQGSAFDIINGAAPRLPSQLPWPADKWTTCHNSYQAVGIEPALKGRERWSTLAAKALQECCGGASTSTAAPLLVATCNGAAAGFDSDSWRHAFDSKALLKNTAWAEQSWPVFSASCNSGLHALFLAKQLLLAGYCDETILLAVDILSPASHDNFEVLRVLSETPTPWQSASSGFVPGEAAVALRLVRVEDDEEAPALVGPTLSSDLDGHDGLSAALSELRPDKLKLILGQGTGPFQSDEMELAALRKSVDEKVALSTPLVRFGHTLGASSLLSIALAVLTLKRNEPLPVLGMDAPSAIDGRPLFQGSAEGDKILITCRALSGACAATSVGPIVRSRPRTVKSWRQPGVHGPLMHPVLRRIATEAQGFRPSVPPDILVVRMDEPLLPGERASIGGRLLPSAVLELTPGFVSQLIARLWGFTGGALCLVGDAEADRTTTAMIQACEENNLTVSRINLCGGMDERAIEWNC